MAYELVRRATGLPSLDSGVLCGIGLWAIGEGLYRSQSDRQQRWSAPPAERLPNLAFYGAVVALVTELLDAMAV
jgi:hypothetical protein